VCAIQSVSIKGVEFRRLAVIEREHEFGAGRTQALQRMRQARREVPQVAGLHVAHLRATFFVD